jgi:hypothetical protein
MSFAQQKIMSAYASIPERANINPVEVLRAEWIEFHPPFKQVRLLIPNPVQQSKKKKSISVI